MNQKEFGELITTIINALPKDGSGGGGVSKEDEVKKAGVLYFGCNFPKLGGITFSFDIEYNSLLVAI